MRKRRIFSKNAGIILIALAGTVLCGSGRADSPPQTPPQTPAQTPSKTPIRTAEGTPQYFTIGAQGELTCQGTTEDACAFFDEIPTPSGTHYVVQGSFSRKRHPSDKTVAAEYVNFYFALLCSREGDRLVPTFSFLEGRERVSDVHFYDLDGDGTLEVIMTAVFGPHGSYASVYRLDGPVPTRIFTRRANTAQTDFDIADGTPTLTFEERDAPGGPARKEVFAWNGTEFAPKK